MVAAYLAGAAR